MNPVVAIVGRPNVGKSTLFNRLTGKPDALVEDIPGVTRDRHYGEAEWTGRRFLLVDTGGFEPEPDEPILAAMKRQTEIAIEEADVVVLLGDGRTGISPADIEVGVHLRRSGKTTVVAVNKVDGPKQENASMDFYSLGCDEVFPISAAHGRGISELLDRIVCLLPPQTEDEPQDEEGSPPAIAVIGRPNAGKSTLINKLLGEERLLTFDEPGTTRDSIEALFVRGERRYRLVDTAGIRRQRSIHERLEKVTVIRALQALDRAHIAWHLIDATEGVTEQDAKIAAFAHEKGRGLVLVVNKWDVAGKEKGAASHIRSEIERKLQFLSYAPIQLVSAKTGARLEKLLAVTDRVYEQYQQRLGTGPLNRFLADLQARHPPPSDKGRTVKLYYISQVSSAPPTFVISTNHPGGVHFSYRRYVVNQLRAAYGFEGIPLRVVYRRRGEKQSTR